MISGGTIRQGKDRRGQTLVEFGACAFLTVMLLLAVVEFGRMVLAYTTVNNAARIGVRYAMVHGSDNGPATLTQVQTIVNNYLSAAAINTSNATVTLSYPGYTAGACAAGGNMPGCPVEVQISYPYQVMVTYFPINVTLAGQAEGVITF